jgi:DNA repair ATPase RecN
MNITVDGIATPITLRIEKNAELTFSELDNNFASLANKTMENDADITAIEARATALETKDVQVNEQLALKATITALKALETLVATLSTQASVTEVNDALTALTDVVNLKATIESVTAVDAKVDALREELVTAGVLTE